MKLNSKAWISRQVIWGERKEILDTNSRIFGFWEVLRVVTQLNLARKELLSL